MARPTKRKGSSSYQFRKATPADILAARKRLEALGIKVAREVTATHSSPSLAEAKVLQAKRLAEWEERLAIRQVGEGESK